MKITMHGMDGEKIVSAEQAIAGTIRSYGSSKRDMIDQQTKIISVLVRYLVEKQILTGAELNAMLDGSYTVEV